MEWKEKGEKRKREVGRESWIEEVKENRRAGEK